MAENKTKPGNESIASYLKRVDPSRIDDCESLIRIMKKISGEEPVIWGDNMVGFGMYHYKYTSGHEGDMFLTGFSPRKSNLTIYCMMGFGRHEELLKSLGKFKKAKSCLYIKSIADVDVKVLTKLIQLSYNDLIAYHKKMKS